MKCSSLEKATAAGASIVIGALIAGTCLIPAPSAYAVTAAEKEAEAQAALNELNAMQEVLQETSARYYQSLTDYAAAIERCDAAQTRINEITDEIASIRARLGDRAREMYRSGSASFVDMLLGAATFEEFAQNWDLLNRLNNTDADLSSQARALREETELQKAEYDEQAAIAEQASNDAAQAYQESEALVIQMEETYNALSAEAMVLYQQEQAAMAAAAAAAAAAAQQAAYYGDGGYYGDYTEGGYTNSDGTVTDIATGQTYSSASEYSAATGNEIVDRAYSMLGHSYRYGATGADGSFDCSGLVGYAITGTTTRIGTTTTFMGYNQVSDPQPGDIAVNAGHTGIYIGNGQMIHAADESTGVVIGDVQSGMIYVRP